MSAQPLSERAAARAGVPDDRARHLLDLALSSSVKGAVAVLGTVTPELPCSLASRLSPMVPPIVVEPDATLRDRIAGVAGKSVALRLVDGDPADLRTDPRAADALLREAPPRDHAGYLRLRQAIRARAAAAPLLNDGSIELAIMDMTLNRQRPLAARQCLGEAFRVLARHGRLVMTVMLADEPLPRLPAALQNWRVEQVPEELELLQWLDGAGFHGTSVAMREDAPAATLDGIEIRGFVIEAFTGKHGACLDQGHAVVLRGPWREVWDDDGHRYVRGERTAVCAKTYALLMRPPYEGLFIGLPSVAAPPLDAAPLFDCSTPRLRHPAITKGHLPPGDTAGTERADAASCVPGQGCC